MSEFEPDFLTSYKQRHRFLPNTHLTKCNSKYVDPVLFRLQVAQVKAELAHHSQAIRQIVTSVKELKEPTPVPKEAVRPNTAFQPRTLAYKRSAYRKAYETFSQIEADFSHIDSALSANKTLGLPPSSLPAARVLRDEFSESWYIREHC
jgi:hypothetical protein